MSSGGGIGALEGGRCVVRVKEGKLDDSGVWWIVCVVNREGRRVVHMWYTAMYRWT